MAVDLDRIMSNLKSVKTPNPTEIRDINTLFKKKSFNFDSMDSKNYEYLNNLNRYKIKKLN